MAVNMPVTLWNCVCLFFLFGGLSTVICSSSTWMSSSKAVRCNDISTCTPDVSTFGDSYNKENLQKACESGRDAMQCFRDAIADCRKGGNIPEETIRSLEIQMDRYDLMLQKSCGSDGKLDVNVNVNTTCSAKPAKNGQLSAIHLYFHGIDFSADQFYIVLEKDDQNETEILHCGDPVTKAAKTCTISHDSFELAGTAGRNMTVIVPVASHELRGMYILRTHVNGSFLSPTSCEFVVYEGNSSSSLPAPPADKQGGPAIIPVVVPVILAIVVVCVVIVIVIVVSRRNKRGRYDQAQTYDKLREDNCSRENNKSNP